MVISAFGFDFHVGASIHETQAQIRVEMFTATGFISLTGTNQNVILSSNQALSSGCRGAAGSTNGILLPNDFGLTHEVGNGAEGTASPIRIEPGNDHAFARIGESFRDGNQILTKELTFIDGNNHSSAFNKA